MALTWSEAKSSWVFLENDVEWEVSDSGVDSGIVCEVDACPAGEVASPAGRRLPL